MSRATVRTTNGATLRRSSRWITLRTLYDITPRHTLADFATDGEVIGFKHNGKWYALDQFERLPVPMFYEDHEGKQHPVSGVDSSMWYRPFLLEVEESGERVRLYEEVSA